MVSTICAGSDLRVGDSVQIESEEVVCEVKASKSRYTAGDNPNVWVTIRNLSGKTITLLGSLDGSERKARYPHAFFEIWGPEGGVKKPELRYCGNQNALRAEDFVSLEPGDGFDPYRDIDSYGFFGAAEFEGTIFVKPGEYKVVFHYSTDEPTVDGWNGTGSEPASGLLERLRNVPRITTSCSTTLTVDGP